MNNELGTCLPTGRIMNYAKLRRLFFVVSMSLILNSLFLIPQIARAEDPPPATNESAADPCTSARGTEGLRCRTARLFGQEDLTASQGSSSLVLRVGTLIRILLSVIGIIFLAFTFYSGVQWIMAGGNEETIKQARARITRSTIGLIIIVGAWVITNFILNAAFRGGPQSSGYAIPGTGGNVRGFIR